MHRSDQPAGFTLLELVVVLGILAILTTLATRALVQVEDQHRFDASQRSLADIQAAILGDPTERASDGTRVIGGFVADLGRLPQAVVTPPDSAGPERYNLRELWEQGTLPEFLPRRAIAENCVTGTAVTLPDGEVVVAAGWHGPYLRLPIGTHDVLDGWGNPYAVPTAGASGVDRLKGSSTLPIAAVGDAIGYVRHLGSDGIVTTPSADKNSYEDDAFVDFKGQIRATTLTAVVTIIEEDSTASSIGESVNVRVFAPYPPDVRKIKIFTNTTPATTSADSATVDLLLSDPVDPTAVVTVGRRAVRAYLTTASGVHPSPVKYVVMQPGVNVVELTVHRPSGAGTVPPPPPVTP